MSNTTYTETIEAKREHIAYQAGREQSGAGERRGEVRRRSSVLCYAKATPPL